MTAVEREQQVRRFFADWGASWESFDESFQILTDDCVWDQRPIPRVRGPVGARRFMNVAHRMLGVETIDVEILSLAVSGDVVHAERIDRLRRGDGSLIAAAPVVGVLTFAGDRIGHWREYFDAGSFTAQIALNSARHLATTALHRARR